MQNDFIVDEGGIENYEQKTLCCLVLDTSSSMKGEPIDQLNNALQSFHREISESKITSNRLELAVITFDSDIDIVVDPELVNNISIPHLVEKGTTRLVDGVREAIRLVETRKDWYKQTGQTYLRPWIILLTDGAPDTGQDMKGLASEIKEGTQGKKYVFLPIGVENANMDKLNEIAGYQFTEDERWERMPAMKLKGLSFFDFFEWLEKSFELMVGGKEGDTQSLPTPKWWEGIKIS